MKQTKSDGKQLTAVRNVNEYFDAYVPRLIAERHKHARTPGGRYHVIVDGEGGGQWTVDLQAERPSISRGLEGRPMRTMRVSAADMIRLLQEDEARRTIFQRGNIDVSLFLDRIVETVVSPQTLAEKLVLGLLGTFIKVDHKNNAPQSGSGAWSYIEFNPLLHQRGLKDRDLNVPINEYGLGMFGDLAALASGGWYVLDRIRVLVNNLNTTLGFDTTKVTLEQDTIVIDIEFESNNPTLQIDGNAYLVWFFGIPVGWVDDAFPDVNITGFEVQLRLIPYVTDDGKLALRDIEVVFKGNLHTDTLTDHVADSIREGITSAFTDNLNTNEIRDALAGALTEIVGQSAGHPITKWTDVYVDATGLTAWTPN